MGRQKVALTAYGPFARSHNSSMQVGEKVADLLQAAGLSVAFRVMETSWCSFAADLEKLVDESEHDVLISLGERPDVRIPVVELKAKNARHKNDVNGVPGTGPVVEGGPQERAAPAEFQVAQRAAHLAGAPIALSDDAGTYLCNAALYVNLGLQQAGRVPCAGFVHVPSRKQDDPFVAEDARAVAEFITQLLKNPSQGPFT